MTKICGNANPNGNVQLTYKGGCDKPVELEEAYRCTGCGGWFHKECIINHFKLESSHDWGKETLKKKIEEWVIENHNHHYFCEEETKTHCVDNDYPYVNSLDLIKLIKKL